MGTTEIGYFMGSGGAIWPFELPLTGEYLKQFDRQELRRVMGEDDPSPYAEPVEVPAPSAMKVEDLRAALAKLGLSTDGNKPDLVARLEVALAPVVEPLPLTEAEILAAIDAELIEDPTADHDVAAVRAKLAELAAK